MCMDYGSINDFELATNRMVCKSGAVAKLDQGTVCIPSPKIVNKAAPTYKCSSPSETCLYESDLGENASHQFELPCRCGLSPTGSSYCGVTFDSDYTSIVAETLKRLAGKCHTLERFDIYECLLRNVETEEDAMLLDRYIKLRYETDHHAEI